MILQNNKGPSDKSVIMNARSTAGCRRHLKNLLKLHIREMTGSFNKPARMTFLFTLINHDSNLIWIYNIN